MDAITQGLVTALGHLQLSPGATFDEVERRYRELRNILHPDPFASSPKRYATAEAEFKRVSEAFQFIDKYKYLLPILSTYYPPGWQGPFPPGPGGQPPPPSPPPITPTPGPISQIQPNRRRALVAALLQTRHRLRNRPGVLLLVVVGLVVLAGAIILAEVDARLASSIHQFERAVVDYERRLERPAPPPKPEPPPRPSLLAPPAPRPTWEPVMRDNEIPGEEIARLVGTSALAVRSAFQHVDYREVDINVDGQYELLITAIEGTCRQEGCPVFLLQRKHGTLRDLLPNNYGVTSLTVLNRQTNGARDIIVTFSVWSTAVDPRLTSYKRPCRLLTWDRRDARYVAADSEPSGDECGTAEKTAWNIAADRHR